MLPNEDHNNAELERLISGALPKLDTASQNRLAYATGFAAGRNQRLIDKAPQGHGSRWMSLASHAACALAAGWLTFAILPTSHATPTRKPQVATSNVPSLIHTTPALPAPSYTSPAADGILRPHTRPNRLVETINSYNGDSKQSALSTDNEPKLNSRSLIF